MGQFGSFAIPAEGLDARFREHDDLDEFKTECRDRHSRASGNPASVLSSFLDPQKNSN